MIRVGNYRFNGFMWVGGCSDLLIYLGGGMHLLICLSLRSIIGFLSVLRINLP